MSTVVSLRELPLGRHDVRGASIAVSELGSGDEVALFVPGFTGGKEDFLAIADGISEAGYRYRAMDQRGQNESTGPEDAAAFTVESLAADLHELIRVIAAPLHLVGHSFGGLVARAAVLIEPSLIRSLTLMSTGPGMLTGPRADAIVALEPLLHERGIEAVYDAIEASAASDPRRAPSTPEVQRFMRRRFLGASPTGLAVMGRALLNADDRVDELRASGVPMLVCHGVADDSWPPHVQTEMAVRLDARHVVFPAAEHSPAAEAPAATVAALVEFWRSIG